VTSDVHGYINLVLGMNFETVTCQLW